jgi:hypothetical protein
MCSITKLIVGFSIKHKKIENGKFHFTKLTSFLVASNQLEPRAFETTLDNIEREFWLPDSITTDKNRKITGMIRWHGIEAKLDPWHFIKNFRNRLRTVKQVHI